MEKSLHRLEVDIENLINKYCELRNEWQSQFIYLLQQFEYVRSNTSTTNGFEPQMTEPANKTLIMAIFNAKSIGAISSNHQNVHSMVSKIGKAIEKNFDSTPLCVGDENLFDDQENSNTLQQIVIEHLLRKEKLDVVHTFINESKSKSQSTFNPFGCLNSTLESLQQHNLEPALNFVKMYRNDLNKIKSDLEFQMYRMEFIEMLKTKSNPLNLIEYAQKIFSTFANNHTSDIQELMGALAHLDTGLENSPYSHLLDSKNWENIYEMFNKDSYAIFKVSKRSPLLATINAGSIALPALNKLNNSFQSNLQELLRSTQELPLEINVTNDYFHTIVNCPVLRQQCSDANPPMRLKCGHVISKMALEELFDGVKIKCPYCSMEQVPSESQRIIF